MSCSYTWKPAALVKTFITSDGVKMYELYFKNSHKHQALPTYYPTPVCVPSDRVWCTCDAMHPLVDDDDRINKYWDDWDDEGDWEDWDDWDDLYDEGDWESVSTGRCPPRKQPPNWGNENVRCRMSR